MNSAPTAAAFDDVTGNDIAALFRILSISAPESLIGITRALVQARDILWLERLLQAGVAEEVGSALGDRRINLLNEMLALEVGARDERTFALLDDWERALGVTAQNLQEALAYMKDPSLLRPYVKRGANPNLPAKSGGAITALSDSFSRLQFDLTTAMLAHLADTGEIPLHSVGPENSKGFFDHLLSGELPSSSQQWLGNHLLSMTLPSAWKQEMAYALNAHEFPRVAGTVVICRAYRQMLSIAEFESERHFADEILARGPLLTTNLVAVRDEVNLAILAKVCEQCTSVDSLPCTISDGAHRSLGTMLHAAVYAKNAAATQMLLSAGANPYRAVEPFPGSTRPHRITGMDAFAIGGAADSDPAQTETRAVLDAWRARQGIHAAINAARRQDTGLN